MSRADGVRFGREMDDREGGGGMEEEVGESSSPPRAFGGLHDIKNDIYARLVESGNVEAVSNPEFRELLDAHFSRLPASYVLDVTVDRAEDVLLHQKILAEARDPVKRPVFCVRFMKYIRTRVDGSNVLQQLKRVISTLSGCDGTIQEGEMPSNLRDCGIDFEPCSKFEDLDLDAGKNTEVIEDEKCLTEALSARKEVINVAVHEIIFSTLDKPKLLSQRWGQLYAGDDVIIASVMRFDASQLSTLLSDIGLNIREAHVFSTTDGYSLDVFVVDGWPVEDTGGLHKEIEASIAKAEGSWSGSSHSSASEKIMAVQQKVSLATEKILAVQPNVGDWEIDKKLLKMGEKIASGSCGDLYHGNYLGQDVAIKILRSEHLTEAQGSEFAQEVMILREVEHKNVVRFVGVCIRPPQFCIVTEYMPGGNLYDFLHKYHNTLDLSTLLKFALDVCKGMDYLHQNNIIHRDLKTANLLMDHDNAIKVADFGVARFQNQGGVMTAETGTYRWMAPEVINHQEYDQKADVFSFAIVLWELVTSKIPYDTMTPLQAALGVRQGLRPEIPVNAHPALLDLIQRCWDTIPARRPSFREITAELEGLLKQVTDEIGNQ